MKIHINQIPLEGLHIEGEEPAEILDLDPKEFRPLSPVRYQLDIGISDNGLFATGSLEVDLELECVTCLERFPHHISVPGFAMQTELTGPETVDLTPYIREDIVLALPPYPHCDSSGEKECKGPGLKPSEPAADEPSVWVELDKLKIQSKN